MMGYPRVVMLVALALSGLFTPLAAADCAVRYDGLETSAGVEANGGFISGTLQFTPAVNGNGASFSGSQYIIYADSAFVAEAGTLTFWFRKNSADTDGGIVQLGTIGQPRSLGLFYVADDYLVFEMRDDDGNLLQAAVPDLLSESEWTHVAAAWECTPGRCVLWIFVNGRIAQWASLDGTRTPVAGLLQVGYTGYHGYGEGVVDELRFFDWQFSDSEAYAEYVWSAERFQKAPSAKPPSTGPVQVVGRRLFVNGAPFTVKSVGYAPTPIGYWPSEYSVFTDPAIIARDLACFETLNLNTIRTWSPPPDTTLLDALYYDAAEPIYAIIGFWIPQNGLDDYSDPGTIAYYESHFRAFVRQFKDHPAVLGWGIGNEVNFNVSTEMLPHWFALANRLAEIAWEEEGALYHPTIVTNAGLWDVGDTALGSDDVSLDYVDMWGHNTYFGADAHCYFDYYERLTDKPLIFTEYGIDALDNRTQTEYQDVHAEYIRRQWRQIKANCAGGSLMAYSDEWWKADSPTTHDAGGYGTRFHPDGYSNEEWWGLFAVEDNGAAPDILHPRLAVSVLAQELAYDAADFDGDGDVDVLDVAEFQVCLGADAAGVCGSVFEFVVDDTLNGADLSGVLDCLRGPDNAPGCLE